jgi:Phosphoglycerol transferase and related proteins, alkaline phosphatase superfamily
MLQKKTLLPWLWAAVLLMVVPNIIFWAIAPRVFIIRGTFVWEYFFLTALVPFVSRKFFITLWILFTLYDMTVCTTAFYFMDFAAIAHALRSIPEVPFTKWLLWAGLVALLITITYALLQLMMRHNKRVRFLHPRFALPMALLFFVVDLLTGQGLIKHPSFALIPLKQNIISVPSAFLAKTIWNLATHTKPEMQSEGYIGSVAQEKFESLPDGAATKKQLFVLVEAWGLFVDPELHRAVLQPLYDMAQQKGYRVQEGTTPFKYLTHAAEMREITGYIVNHYDANEDFARKYSLFYRKQQEGYRVTGVHGYHYSFYNRIHIWPALGVQEMYFANKLKEQGLPECGDHFFRGICDTAIATWVLNYIQQNPQRKDFIYWLTLNTHLPLTNIHDDQYRSFAVPWQNKNIPEDVLQLAYQHHLLFKDLANKLSNPLAPQPHMLLVGDHAPPYVDRNLRRHFDNKLVPYIELFPLN